MDRHILLRPREEYPYQVKTEIKTELKTDGFYSEIDNSPQHYQQCIIKEEVMLSSDMEYSADELESKSHDHEKRNDDHLMDENTYKHQKTLSASSIKLRALKKDDKDLGIVISKFGKANCTKCRKQFKAVSRKTRCKLCSGTYLYVCSICPDSTYKTFTDLCHHLKLKHTSLRELYTCSNCHKIFNQPKRLNEHVKVCGSNPRFKCEFCSYRARYKCNLVNHVKSKHKPVALSCDRCGKRYTHERSMRRHVKIYCGKSRSVECEHCQFGAYRKDQLVGHMKFKHPELFSESV